MFTVGSLFYPVNTPWCFIIVYMYVYIWLRGTFLSFAFLSLPFSDSTDRQTSSPKCS